MQTQAPSPGRILIAVGFALSCFGLLLFLWVSFGGPVPLASKSYRFTAYFPEATSLALESDVRIGGVSVGKVKAIEPAPAGLRLNGKDLTAAEIEIEPEFAPLSADARAILRQKTLLGETYVELTAGTAAGPDELPPPVSFGAASGVSDAEALSVGTIPEGGELAVGQVTEAVQVDELFDALDKRTQSATQKLLASNAIALSGRGQDINDALGNIAPLLTDATTLTRTVNGQRTALRSLIRDSGAVLDALSAERSTLQGTVTGAADTFAGLAAADESLAETVSILPTFEREALLTLRRVDELRRNAEPLVDELLPVAGDISPTLQSVEELAPEARRLFVTLGPLFDAAERGMPALARTIRGVRPLLADLDPLLAQLAPVVRYLSAYREIVSTFFVNPPIGISSTLPKTDGQPAPRHYLRALAYVSPETLGIHPSRLATNRGNAYVPPGGYEKAAVSGSFPSFDCKNTDYNPISQDPDEDEVTLDQDPPADVNQGRRFSDDFATCRITGGYPDQFGGLRGPQLPADPDDGPPR